MYSPSGAEYPLIGGVAVGPFISKGISVSSSCTYKHITENEKGTSIYTTGSGSCTSTQQRMRKALAHTNGTGSYTNTQQREWERYQHIQLVLVVIHTTENEKGISTYNWYWQLYTQQRMRKAPAHTNSIGSRTNTTKRMRKAPVHKNGTGSHTHTHAIKRMRKAPANAERANLLPHKRQTATEVLDCQYITENWQAHRGFWAVCPTSFLTSFQSDCHVALCRLVECMLIWVFKLS